MIPETIFFVFFNKKYFDTAESYKIKTLRSLYKTSSTATYNEEYIICTSIQYEYAELAYILRNRFSHSNVTNNNL